MAPKGTAIKADDDWKVESDLRTLCEAEAIKKDPKRLKACQDMAKKKMMDMAAVASDSDKE